MIWVGCPQRAAWRSVRRGDHGGRAGLAGRGAPGAAAAARARHHLHQDPLLESHAVREVCVPGCRHIGELFWHLSQTDLSSLKFN